MGDVAKDLASGTVGGVAQLVVGHPFDTIKVKLQSQPAPVPGQPPKFSGAMDAVRQTLAAEGPRGLYKGMGAPLATVAVFNAVLFTVRGQMETLLRSEPGVPLTVGQQVIAGAGAGLAVSFLACPTELIKCRLQAQSAMAETGAGAVAVAVKYGGPMDVAKHFQAKQMEKLVPNWYSAAQPLPETYIFPPDVRPGKFSIAPSSKDIPVIDLGSQSQSHDRAHVIQQILEASQEFGFFQVINHGIPEALMNDTMDVFKEFFELPLEEKRASIHSDDPNKLCKLIHSSVNYDWEEAHLWRDFIRHPCEPLEKFTPIWPRKPTKYREHVSKCFIQVKKVALDILELIGEGLGIGSEYFSDELSKETDIFVNHYPPCPDPSLTLGITKHSDPQLITILLQGDVSGLQVFKDGEWIGVEPIANGLVVNIGYQLRIISNGKLKCAEHRVVTNSSTVRTTIGFFITPSPDCFIEPAAALINASNPRLYRGFRYEEFRANYFKKQGKTEVVLEPFKIES